MPACLFRGRPCAAVDVCPTPDIRYSKGRSAAGSPTNGACLGDSVGKAAGTAWSAAADARRVAVRADEKLGPRSAGQGEPFPVGFQVWLAAQVTRGGNKDDSSVAVRALCALDAGGGGLCVDYQLNETVVGCGGVALGDDTTPRRCPAGCPPARGQVVWHTGDRGGAGGSRLLGDEITVVRRQW